MKSSFCLIFIAILISTPVLISAQNNQTCDVGEDEKVVGGGACNDVKGEGEEKCREFCQKEHGPEFVSSECSEVRSDGKRECICKVKCANGGCWGDPHCYTFDGAKFGYQGTSKHYLIKPNDGVTYRRLPYFDICQENYPWQFNARMSSLSKLELNVRDWKQKIEITAPRTMSEKCTVKVNGSPKSIPYKYTEIRNGYKKRSIKIFFADSYRNSLKIETSFGLRIITTIFGYAGVPYGDMVVSIPRHSDLKGKSCGLLGRWDDNIRNDFIDANGQNQTHDNAFSWEFGDSWCVDSGGKKPKNQRDKVKKDHQDHINKSKKDPMMDKRIKKLCQPLEKFQSCHKARGRVAPQVDDCYTDLSYIKKSKDQENVACGIVKNANQLCSMNVQCEKVTDGGRSNNVSGNKRSN